MNLRRLWVLAALGAVLASDPSPANAVELELHTYMRAGTGVNSKGGKQTCFSNSGAWSNEFRLGNECSIYGEAYFRAWVQKNLKPEDPFFYSQVTFAYFPPADTQYEDSDTDADRRDINVVEAYAEGGNFDGTRLTYWAGKRFYRSVDVHMNDFYYFEAMNGAGAGIGSINAGIGKLAVALLRESDLVYTGTTPITRDTSRNESTIGALGKTALDLRLDDVALSETDSLHFWGVGAYSPPGYSTTTSSSYQAGRGFIAGVRYRKNLSGGFNDLTLAYGTGIMESMQLSGSAAVADGASTNDAKRLRLVEHLVTRFSPNFQMAFSGTYEDRNNGGSVDPKTTWWNLGVWPAYFFTDHLHLIGQLGHSEVKSEADRVGGNRIGARQLNRIAIAPEIGMNSDIWARPVVRFIVAHSFWNDDAKGFNPGGSAYAGETAGTSVAVQTEVWF